MKKFLVFLLWIFLGLLIPSILGIILPKFYNDNIGIFGLIIFILSVYIGYRNFHKVKSSELAKKLVDVYSYTENSVASMSPQEISLRHDMHIKTQFEDLINLTFNELKDRKISFDKENMTDAQIKRAERQLKSKEDLKKSFTELKVAATELKDHVATLPSVIDETKENFKELKIETKRLATEPGYMGKIFESKNSTSSDSSNNKAESSTKIDKSNIQTKTGLQLAAEAMYEEDLKIIRKCEDKIAELKIKIDDAKRYREERLHLHDEINRRMVEVYDEEIVKYSAEVRVLEKEMHESVLKKRNYEDRVKR
jgi:hypothetical protein